MTTNVFDEKTGVMATDSRWSISSGKYVLYVDDSGFEKIEIQQGHAFIFAGNGIRIEQWRDWIRTNPEDDSMQPKEEGICLCIVNLESKKAVRFIKQSLIGDTGYFAGSGQLYAAGCWLKNKCAKTAVETAKQFDVYSGGEVKYYDAALGDHNLNYPSGRITIQMVNDAILTRGQVMEQMTKQIGFSPAANDSIEIADIRSKIAAGDLSANAPSDGMYDSWSIDEKASLKHTLSEIFKWKK